MCARVNEAGAKKETGVVEREQEVGNKRKERKEA